MFSTVLHMYVETKNIRAADLYSTVEKVAGCGYRIYQSEDACALCILVCHCTQNPSLEAQCMLKNNVVLCYLCVLKCWIIIV